MLSSAALFIERKMSIDDATPDQWNKAAKPKSADVTDTLATQMLPSDFRGYCQGQVLNLILRATREQNQTVNHLREARKFIDRWLNQEVQP
jgi:hypothetical protein